MKTESLAFIRGTETDIVRFVRTVSRKAFVVIYRTKGGNYLTFTLNKELPEDLLSELNLEFVSRRDLGRRARLVDADLNIIVNGNNDGII